MQSPELRYRSLFERAPSEQMAALRSALASERLGGLPVLGMPVFLTGRELRRFARLTERLSSAITRLVRLFLDEGAFRGLVPISEAAHELARLDPGYSGVHVFTRFDALYDRESGSLQFLECNAGDPSGMAYNDALLRAFGAVPALAELRGQTALFGWPLVEAHRSLLLGKWAEFQARRGHEPSPKPALALAVARESTVLEDHRALLASHREAGLAARIVDPRDFEYDGRTLTSEGSRVDLVFRDTVDEFLLEPYRAGTGPFLDACRAGAVCVLNPFSAVVADFKGLFEALSDPAWQHLCTEEERAALRESVPWTRVVTPRWVEELRARREQFVLKPNEGYGGFGVRIGRETSAADWDALLGSALQRPASYVAQRYVAPPAVEFPVFDAGVYAGFAPKNVTLSFWAFDSVFAGAFARASDAAVVNLHQGGGLLPVFVHEDET